jgi:predicted Zn-dependent protease
VIAHEIGHDNFHHPGRTITRQLFWMTGKKDVTSAEDTKLALKNLLAAYRENVGAQIAEAASGISRFDEQSADKAAFYFLYKAGYNPHAIGQFIWRMPDPAAQELAREAPVLFPIFYGLILLFESHPPNYWRTMSIEWESNFVAKIPKHDFYDSPGFTAMKRRLKYLDEMEVVRQRELRAKRAGAGNKATPKINPD